MISGCYANMLKRFLADEIRTKFPWDNDDS
jgi:hypothetical protein